MLYIKISFLTTKLQSLLKISETTLLESMNQENHFKEHHSTGDSLVLLLQEVKSKVINQQCFQMKIWIQGTREEECSLSKIVEMIQTNLNSWSLLIKHRLWTDITTLLESLSKVRKYFQLLKHQQQDTDILLMKSKLRDVAPNEQKHSYLNSYK